MKIAIIGSRQVKNVSFDKFSSHIPQQCSMIISGGAVGIDKLAEHYAKLQKIDFRCFLPDYDFWGKKAPLIRNTSIVKESDEVIAFWDQKSRGTAFVIKEALRLNKTIKIVPIEDICID